jgi:hypothetical protein
VQAKAAGSKTLFLKGPFLTRKENAARDAKDMLSMAETSKS